MFHGSSPPVGLYPVMQPTGYRAAKAMRRILSEPLLHFLVLGALLFGLSSWLGRGGAPTAGPERQQVRVTASDLQWLVESWSKRWLRQPSPDELRGLVTDHLREELLSREARILGLDRNDTYIRRRLAQKAEFLIQDASDAAEPTEADLIALHAAHPALFSEGPWRSFRQIYFAAAHREQAVAALTALRGGADPSGVGDRLSLEAAYTDVDPTEIAKLFGDRFADEVLALPEGSWHGPIASGYGLHLVQVQSVRAGQVRPFASVREQVRERWFDRQRCQAQERYYGELMKRYEIVADDAVRPLIGPLAAPWNPGR